MASSSPCCDQSTDKEDYCIESMASDDVPSVSHDLCQPKIPIRTFNDLKPITPFILPHPYTSYFDYERDHCRYDPAEEAPKKKYKSSFIFPTAPQICTCTCSSRPERIFAHMDDLYIPLAKKALAYYNAKENTNLSFVKVTAARFHGGPEKKVHMNFIATSEDGMEKLVFSELVNASVLKLKASTYLEEYDVRGCSLLEKIESGNPIGWGCSMCGEEGNEVIHPGPRHGYLVVGGDMFQGYPFWGYRFPPRTRYPTADHQRMYIACARKALEHFKSKQPESSGFMNVEFQVEVVGRYTYPCLHKKIVHINIKCITGIGSGQELFFAELVVPSFTVEDYGWDNRKEPFIVVKGCCLLEKVDSGKPFGRVCEVCYCNEVIHPGSKDGYRVAVGDDFTGYGFMNIGGGIF